MNNEKKSPVRQIKFRGLRVDGKGWVYGLIVKRKSKYFIEVEFTDLEDEVIYRAYEVIPETVGQFTGLLDKNGKEVYEGDILYHSVQGKRFVYYPFAKDVASFGLHNIENGFKTILNDASVLYEVIGNIHYESEVGS